MPTFTCRCLRYHEYGDPTKVLKLETVDIDTDTLLKKPTQVLVRWLASTILPADINIVNNVYWKRRPPPAFLGSEGVGVVEKVGADVRELAAGDQVIALDSSEGLWVEWQAVEAAALYKLDRRINLQTAATFVANPPTAWMMLRNYVQLKAGDFVLQNAANSGVGCAVIELAHAWGYRTINVVRDRPDIASVREELRDLGADFVFTEEEFARDGRKFVAALERPVRLALNGVGGRSALRLGAALGRGGTMVVYGGMSKEPHQITTGALVFNDVKVVGVLMGAALAPPHGAELRRRIFGELEQLAVAGKLRGQRCEEQPMANYVEALRRAMAGKHRKQLLILGRDASPRL